MRYLDGKSVYIDGKEVAILHQSLSGVVTVKQLTACSIGTYLRVVAWLRELGYEAK